MIQITKSMKAGLIGGIIALIFLCMIPSLFERVGTEQITALQAPISGKMTYWTTPGLKFQECGSITRYYKTQQLWFGSDDDHGKQMGEPIPVIFNDASDGLIYGSLRVKLPTDIEHLNRIQTDYHGMDRLMNDLVKQTVVKVIYASGPLMSAFESYAEKKNNLIEYITDQLTYGVYKTSVKQVETTDPITGEIKKVKVATLIEDPNAPGGYQRSETSPFAFYGIETGQVAVSKIDYSNQVRQQIAKQQEANMAIQTAKAEAAAAQQNAIKAEEEGKAIAMQAKWSQEKEKAVAVTKAEQERETARLAAEKAEFDKKRIIAEGEAEAAANRAKVAAGLTPQERAEWEYKTKVGVAEAIAKVQLPKIIAGGGQGSSNAMDMMSLKFATDLVDKLSK
jgi:uncharacterized membrane protein